MGSLLTLRSLVSVFPAGINVGATWSKRLAHERGKAMGVENRDKGVTVLLGPVAGGLGRVWQSPKSHIVFTY
jgi:beta-glucosidase-like glycosyl hydrolase